VDQLFDLSRNVARRGAVDHQDVESPIADRLSPQPIEAIAQIAGPVMRTDADSDVHAAQSAPLALRKD
jgi:hypothetical protein